MTRITLETQGHILLIGLNRPEKLNAADEQMLHELSLAYGKLDTDHNLRVGLVFAHGDHFTAGLDLQDVGPKLAAGKLQMVPEGGLDPWGITTKQVSKPVVMATRGTCFTLGVELALASDVVVAATDSRFAQLEVSRGIMPFGGGTIRFPAVAGHANAMRYLLTGDSFDAQQALAMNLVTQVCDPGEEFDKALENCESSCKAGAACCAGHTCLGKSNRFGARKKQVFQRLASLMQTKDVTRGMEAFITKQPAKFEGN